MATKLDSIVAFETVPVEETDIDHSLEFIRRMQEDNLPAFVVRSVSPDAYTTFEAFEEPFRVRGFRRSQKRPIPFDRPNELIPDRELHVDFDNPVSRKTKTFSVHHTSRGTVQASFLAGAQEFPDERDIRKLPSTYADLEHGIVDSEIFDPTLYQTTLGPGDVVVCRTTGRIMLAHEFKTLEYPRLSHLIDLVPTSNK
ncbi:MAG TPA: hypothetical protein VLE69_02370 [Candidatus Saccharimonadales bacterium]|nr:hypothetical protein [Candidatus Saccharimonadales bacterium]